MTYNHVDGVIVRLRSGFYYVRMETGEVVCKLRGRLKQDRLNETLAAVGDHVTVQLLNDGSGVIEEIHPRQTEFFRMAPTARGEFKQVLLANLNHLVLVFACADPQPSLRMLDRFLVIAEKQHIPALIVANKIDLVSMSEARRQFDIYQSLGYRVLFTSARTGKNIEALKKLLAGNISAFSGPSGSGKSSLLNQIQPELGLRVGTLKKSSGKGRHTTVVRELYPLEEGGYVADMPGLRSLSLWDTEPDELDGYFPELRDLVPHCQFNNCSHITEPDCAVKQAVADGEIHASRYDSYVRLRLGDEDS